jgi:putative ATP-binding cassette transporter
MTFLQLVRREMRGSLPKLVFMAAIGGVSNAAILAAINASSQAAGGTQEDGLWAISLFLVSLFLFITAQRYIYITSTAEIEAIIHRVRLRLIDQVRRSELLALEKIGRSVIVAAITGDAATLTQASRIAAFAVQGTVLIFCVAIYVAYLSLTAFALSAAIIGTAAAIFHFTNRSNLRASTMAEGERELLDRVGDFLEGFKEVRLNSARSEDLFDDAVEVSRIAANKKIRHQSETYDRIVVAQSSIYVALGAVVFVAPRFVASLGGSSITKTTTALLFVVGACFGLVQSIPIMVAANAAADRLHRLEVDLRATSVSAGTSETETPKRFDRIEMRDIVFSYVDKAFETVFRIGPLNFVLHPGELVFITGGNGSGKSTFLRLLAGLYPPDSGEITLDGDAVTDQTRETYRGLISAIFTDYHLFRRLYGISEPEPVEFDRLLREFRLAEKTGLSHGEFRTLDLSGGQRKRVAMIVSLLERRPILLLDEWASDQDPEFRLRFYQKVLPEFMQAGKTVVVVTHDDLYIADVSLPARWVRMDAGRIIEQRSTRNG